MPGNNLLLMVAANQPANTGIPVWGMLLLYFVVLPAMLAIFIDWSSIKAHFRGEDRDPGENRKQQVFEQVLIENCKRNKNAG